MGVLHGVAGSGFPQLSSFGVAAQWHRLSGCRLARDAGMRVEKPMGLSARRFFLIGRVHALNTNRVEDGEQGHSDVGKHSLSHGARPPAPRASTTAFTAKASQMFCQTRVCVTAAMRRATVILRGWSTRIVTSAVSMVASDPRPPVAMPTSAGLPRGRH